MRKIKMSSLQRKTTRPTSATLSSHRPTIFVFVFVFLIGTAAPLFPNTAKAKELPSIQEIWTHTEDNDPNGLKERYLKISSPHYEQLFTKIQRNLYSPRAWLADINNDGQNEYVVLTTKHTNEDGSSSSPLLDKLESVYSIEKKELKKIPIPKIPITYTNILQPFIEAGPDGIAFNLHYAAHISKEGKPLSIGNQTPDKPFAFVLSRRHRLIWKDHSIRVTRTRYICNEAPCDKKQIGLIKKANLYFTP